MTSSRHLMRDQIAMLCDSSAIIANNKIKLAFCVSETANNEHIHIGFYYILLLLLSMRVWQWDFPIECGTQCAIARLLLSCHRKPWYYLFMATILFLRAPCTASFPVIFWKPFLSFVSGEPLEKLVIYRPRRSDSMRSSSSPSSWPRMAVVLADGNVFRREQTTCNGQRER